MNEKGETISAADLAATVRSAHAKALEALAADVHPYSATSVRHWGVQLEATLDALQAQAEQAIKVRDQFVMKADEVMGRALSAEAVSDGYAKALVSMTQKKQAAEAERDEWKEKAQFAGVPAWERLWSEKQSAEAERDRLREVNEYKTATVAELLGERDRLIEDRDRWKGRATILARQSQENVRLAARVTELESERDRFDDEAERKGLLAAEWKVQHDEMKDERDKLRGDVQFQHERRKGAEAECDRLLAIIDNLDREHERLRETAEYHQIAAAQTYSHYRALRDERDELDENIARLEGALDQAHKDYDETKDERDRLREDARVIAKELDRMNGAYQRVCDEKAALAARVTELERERDEQFSGRVQANRRARLVEARVAELVALVRIGFLVTVDGERATADFVRDPKLRALLLTILQAKDTDAARSALTEPAELEAAQSQEVECDHSQWRAAEARVTELEDERDRAERERDATGKARLLAEARVTELEDPGFEQFVALTDTFLAHYPDDIFDGSSGDPGPVFIVALRVARAALAGEGQEEDEYRAVGKWESRRPAARTPFDAEWLEADKPDGPAQEEQP